MSFQFTEPQFLDGTKDVTRRLGWTSLKPGRRLRAVRKCMGLKKGEKHVVLGEFRVVSVRQEPLYAITPEDVRREGYPNGNVEIFVSEFCRKMKCQPWTLVNRIEFVRTDLCAATPKTE